MHSGRTEKVLGCTVAERRARDDVALKESERLARKTGTVKTHVRPTDVLRGGNPDRTIKRVPL